MDRQEIVAEIQRIALGNRGHAPGEQAFERATAIKKAEWYPYIWLRWSDAIAEAGLTPNVFQTKTSDDTLIEKYIGLARELGRIPVSGEIKRKGREDQSFPAHTVFNRLGGKDKLIEMVVAYCRAKGGFDEVLALCAKHVTKYARTKATMGGPKRVVTGFVYLMKSGPHYKIGRTNSVARRGGELAVKIPVPPKTIHSIETDDPVGVESYWHRRFAEKRGEGEWFTLSPEDVIAFKQWKRII